MVLVKTATGGKSPRQSSGKKPKSRSSSKATKSSTKTPTARTANATPGRRRVPGQQKPRVRSSKVKDSMEISEDTPLSDLQRKARSVGIPFGGKKKSQLVKEILRYMRSAHN